VDDDEDYNGQANKKPIAQKVCIKVNKDYSEQANKSTSKENSRGSSKRSSFNK